MRLSASRTRRGKPLGGARASRDGEGQTTVTLWRAECIRGAECISGEKRAADRYRCCRPPLARRGSQSCRDGSQRCCLRERNQRGEGAPGYFVSPAQHCARGYATDGERAAENGRCVTPPLRDDSCTSSAMKGQDLIVVRAWRLAAHTHTHTQTTGTTRQIDRTHANTH
uniref:Uncharacterized protein n=1 Tax=Chrysotila carterae TaxID=13221 RepID=A0A7S4BZ86_CHRCT